MTVIIIIVIIFAVIIAITGGLVEGLEWLLWIGISVIAILAIGWVIRAIMGRRNQ